MINVGIDTLDFDRIKDVDSFALKVLHKEELEVFNSLTARKLEYVASRFSLKEAFVKATSLKDVSFKEIKILNDECGKPHLTYKNYVTSVSISHERTHCVTICLWEGFR